MKIIARKHNNFLTPETGFNLDKYAHNDILEVTIRKPRNVLFHRKFFGLLNQFHEAVDPDYSVDDMRMIFTMRAGYFNRVVTQKGEAFLPRSISFDSMDEAQFNEFYMKFNEALMDEFGVNLDTIEFEF